MAHEPRDNHCVVFFYSHDLDQTVSAHLLGQHAYLMRPAEWPRQ
jgi:hypothetical protein